MARPRIPRAKAAVEARDKKNPQRFSNRKEPKSIGDLGDPPEWMGGEQRAAWKVFQREIPWLTESHRGLVEIAAIIRARLAAGEEVGVQALNLLRQCLGQMGATPADASKVSVGDDDEEQEHQQMLELYSDQLRERSELEWSQFRDAAHIITPGSSSSPTAVQGQPECWAPLQALPPWSGTRTSSVPSRSACE